jgi:hypothetical protein
MQETFMRESCGRAMSVVSGARKSCSILGVLFLAAASTGAQPASPRLTIDLSAGLPGEGRWLYIRDSDSTAYASPTFNDAAWTPVGVPHGANMLTTFLNQGSGGGDGNLNGSNNWYRLHFRLSPAFANRKIMVELAGSHTGVQVYVNGTLLPGITAVPGNSQASHVVGFLPFIADITPYVHADGGTDNVLAVRVSRNAAWFVPPQFSTAFRFGQSECGLFRPVTLHITHKVRIPRNVYSNQRTWGTYVNTVSIVPAASGTATAASAVIAVQTNVLNETGSAQSVTLTTQIVDASGAVVASAPDVTQSIGNMAPGSYPSSATPMFDQRITINNPTLWYPNNSLYGRPYLYRVNHIVKLGGVVVDAAQSPLGIRTITWDQNVPYFNGHAMYLYGGSGRYDYPALGSAVPEEQQWRDLQLMAAAGGNLWRPGHSSSSEEFVNAADAYGIMIVQPSGEGEGAFYAPSTDTLTLKQELHRDMIIRDRSHPSILAWEASNGPMAQSVGASLQSITNLWDPINPRVQADRTPDPRNGYILGCTLEGCEVGVKNQFPGNPAWGAEYWGNGTARGLAWDFELAHAAPFLDNWRKGRAANAFGMVQWYFADTPGEDSLFVEFAGNPAMQSQVRSLGASMVDQNRFPKLLYYVYRAAWTPFSLRPVIHLAHHWNRSGTVRVNAFSNCPSTRLLINGVQQGPDVVPNPWSSDTSGNLTQTTTTMPFQSSWNVPWVSGTVTAQCLNASGAVVASDSRVTAGAASRIVLAAVPALVRPDGTSFTLRANGSDAAFVEARVVDAGGHVVPTAAHLLTFSVSGPATYMGGTQQYVQSGSNAYSSANGANRYHSPGDPELQAEGGMTKIALRTQFAAGTVTVTASSPGLTSGSASFTVQAVPPLPNVTPLPTPTPTATPIGGPNLALGKTCVASSQLLPCADAFDGSASTRWESTQGVDPQWVWVDLGAPSTVARIVLQWETASARSYQIQTSNDAANWTNIYTTTTGPGGTETLTVSGSGRYVRMYGTVRNTGYGYSLWEFAVHGTQAATPTPTPTATPRPTSTPTPTATDISTCGGATARYTILSATLVQDNQTGLTWQRVQTTYTDPGAQYTQPIAQSYCASQGMRLPTQGEALGVAGTAHFASCAWPSPWLTWTSTINAANTAQAAVVTSSGQWSWQVATNYPGGVVCTSNTAVATPTATARITPTPTPTVANGTNRALNRPAAASSVENGGSGANLAVDGNPGTRWSSAFSDPQWISVDLGVTTSISRVVLIWEAAYASGYQIQTSNDAAAWTSVYSTTTGDGGTDDLVVSGSGRYVRLYGTVRATGWGYSLWELQVYGGAAATPTATARPRATASATATARARATTRPTPTTRPTSTPTARGTATPTARPAGSALSINCGGGAASPYVADIHFAGGSTFAVTNAITTTGVTSPAPQAVYQSARQGASTYTIPGMAAGSTHTVRLHFAELWFTAAGQRLFNVSINGATVLTNFDIVAASGARYGAAVRTFTATANASGQIVIAATHGTLDQPMMNGIEVQ